MSSPKERREELNEVKNKLTLIKAMKADRVKRIRHNFLVTHCYPKDKISSAMENQKTPANGNLF